MKITEDNEIYLLFGIIWICIGIIGVSIGAIGCFLFILAGCVILVGFFAIQPDEKEAR